MREKFHKHLEYLKKLKVSSINIIIKYTKWIQAIWNTLKSTDWKMVDEKVTIILAFARWFMLIFWVWMARWPEYIGNIIGPDDTFLAMISIIAYIAYLLLMGVSLAESLFLVQIEARAKFYKNMWLGSEERMRRFIDELRAALEKQEKEIKISEDEMKDSKFGVDVNI